jgi:hypothetical protein
MAMLAALALLRHTPGQGNPALPELQAIGVSHDRCAWRCRGGNSFAAELTSEVEASRPLPASWW